MTTNRPEFQAHDDFIFEHKEVGKVTREEFIKYIRSSHEHMRKLSQIIQQYNQTIEEYLNEWDGKFESFDDDVKDLLGQWIQDGTMDHIINENLMSIKADKSYVDDLNENVTAQLAHKADKGNISVNDINKNLGKLDGSFFTDEFNQQLSNGDLNVTNLLDGSVTEKKLADKSTTLNKLGNDLVVQSQSINLIKWAEEDLNANGDYDRAGNFVTNPYIISSPFIPVTPNLEYTKERNITNAELSFWDEEFNYVTGFRFTPGNQLQTFVVPNNDRIKYLRFGVSKGSVDRAMLIQGTSAEYPDQFMAYSESILRVEKELEEIPKYSINLINPKKVITSGSFSSNGTFSLSSSYSSTGLIKVKPGEFLSHTIGERPITFWDSDLNFVSSMSSSNLIKVPDDNRIKYMRVSMTANWENHMITRGFEIPNNFIAYEEHTSESDLEETLKPSEISGVIDILETGRNLIDLMRIEPGIYYDRDTGTKKSLASFGTSDFIPVSPNEILTKEKMGTMGHVTFWDEDYNFITGVSGNRSLNIKVPSNNDIRYMRVLLELDSLGDGVGLFRGKGYPSHRYLVEEGLFKEVKPDYLVKPFDKVVNPVITPDIVTDRTGVTGVADPFLVNHKGRYHMFFEVIHAETEEIGHAYSDNLIDWTYTQIVLSKQEHGHRSAYPHVFKVDGEWYMLPDGGGVKVYKATSFPYEWEFVTELLPNGVDTNVFKFDGVWYMTTSMLSRGVELYVNTSGNWLNNEWQLHPAGLIIPHDDITGGRRGAGNQRILDDCVYLPIQGTPPGAPYGQRTDLFKIINLTPTTAEAVNLGVLVENQKNEDWNDNTMHHISRSEYFGRSIYAVDGTGPYRGYSIGLYVDNI